MRGKGRKREKFAKRRGKGIPPHQLFAKELVWGYTPLVMKTARNNNQDVTEAL